MRRFARTLRGGIKHAKDRGVKWQTLSNLVKKIKDDEIKFVDLRFTDPRGKMQHVTMDVREMDEDAFTDGIMFDGSRSPAGR